MKKNTMMRIAAALLVLVMITTCAISGTFAKYITTGGSNDTARVAKWGVEISATSNSAFKTEYAEEAATDDAILNSVVTSPAGGADGKRLVAPGTSGSLTAVGITGTPEVAVKVSYASTLTLTGWKIPDDQGTEYCPIVITVGTTDYKIDDTITTVSALEDAVEAAINGYTDEYAANTDLSTAAAAPAVSWAWAYEGGAGAYQTDAKDTDLGNLATAPTITLAITTTVTQIN